LKDQIKSVDTKYTKKATSPRKTMRRGAPGIR